MAIQLLRCKCLKEKGKTTMKLRLLLICALLFAPILGMASRVQSGQSGGSIPITTLNFGFTMDITGPGQFITPTFANETGGTIYMVTITPEFGAYTTGGGGNSCGFSVYFSNCTFPTGDDGSWTFFGLPGIPQHIPGVGGGEFDFSFFGFNVGSWDMEGTLVLVPEPTTLLLIGPALAGLWVKRKSFIR